MHVFWRFLKKFDFSRKYAQSQERVFFCTAALSTCSWVYFLNRFRKVHFSDEMIILEFRRNKLDKHTCIWINIYRQKFEKFNFLIFLTFLSCARCPHDHFGAITPVEASVHSANFASRMVKIWKFWFFWESARNVTFNLCVKRQILMRISWSFGL